LGRKKMGLFRKLKDTVKEVGLINEYCDHLREIGINATVLGSDSSDYIGGMLSLGCVKIEDKNIGLVQVARQPVVGTQVAYQYHYVVRTNVEGFEDQLKAESKPVKKGLLSKEVVDLKWEGGQIAQTLNLDNDLKSVLLKNELDKVVLKVDRKQQIVTITHPPKIPRQVSVSFGGLPYIPLGKLTAGRKEFPTLEEFNAYERIAQYVLNLTNPPT